MRIAELGFGVFLALKIHHALWWLHSEQRDDPSAPSTLKPYTIVCVCAFWRFHGLRIHHHGCAHGNACIKRAACDWLCTIGLRQKLTSPLCIVKVKTTRGQNDMNKSIIAPPCSSMRELEGGKLHIHLRGQETSAYFHFAPWPLPDSEGHQKRHFIRIIMEQRGVGGFFFCAQHWSGSFWIPLT